MDNLRQLPRLLAGESELIRILGAQGATLAVPEPARAFTLAALAHASERRPLVIATPSASDADRLAHDLAAWLEPHEVDTFPAWETLPFERVSPSVETMGRRLRTMWRLRQPDRIPRVIVSPARALVQRLGPHVEDVDPVVVSPGDQVDPEDLVERLVAAGYRREYQVEHRGELAVRGSIVDVFPSTADGPIRIDLWGDEVDRLTEFSVSEQRSTHDIECAEIFPCRELLPTPEVRERAAALVGTEPWGRQQWERLSEGATFDGMESWLPWVTEGEHLLADLVPSDALVVLLEPRRMKDRASEILDEEEALASTLSRTWGAEGRQFPRLHLPFDRLLAHTSAPVLSMTAVAEGPGTSTIEARGWGGVVSDTQHLTKQVAELAGEGYRVVLAADGAGSAARMEGLFRDEGVTVETAIAPIERGFVIPPIKLAVLSEGDVTGRRRAHRKSRPRTRLSETFFDDLAPGSFVVHHTHGVARYGGMVRRAIGGAERDYLLLEYRGGDKLYVPSDQIDAVRPFTGGETPSVSRLGGGDWTKTKARVRAAVAEIAQELVVLYRRRATSEGHAFSPDTPWQREMEDSFPYVETPDQAKAIEEVKADMEQTVPMDRLVCGDVGFGKTEVAIRAVFKAVQDGFQAAVLVPTTLLAQQHFQTFSERFSGYPVRVEVISRFLTPAQQRAVVNGLADGTVDVVIGTHRLLSNDVRWKNLGLLVVDEEQRFGVGHKEAIKTLRAEVDVLTLTATPIPRTLEMSLTGIRDLTLLHTPPAERQPILTYVGEYDEAAVSEAIRRELLREGQVFFVHNRVADIEHVAQGIRELVPEARVAVAHGQMDEGTLEQVVLDFWEGQFDVLVCTTIIESGIDMPTVNTLVVDRADLLGLGQLHQLRGRVGRAGQRAYAYLFFPRDRSLSEEAYERLRTIGEQTELGSGFKIAMRDLEIRGAGHLLGENQSGHIAAVGYDLYVQMVSEAVSELKGEELKVPAEIKIEVPVDANLPAGYVGREDVRLDAYRRLATVTTPEEVDDIRAEWLDRFGPIPPPAEALLGVARLRAECSRAGVREVAVARDTARISPITLPVSRQMRLKRLHPRAVYKDDLHQLVLPLASGTRGPALTDALVTFLAEMVPPEPAEAAPSVPSPA